jgi:carboxymethylenebutenolidase
MQRKKASDFDQRILELYDGYVHGRMSKRAFLDHASKYAVGGVSAAALLSSLQPNYALAQQVAPDDPAIETETVEYPSPEGHGTVRGLMARPAGVEGPLPAVRWYTRTAGSIPTSRTWSAGSARPASWRSGRTA